MRATRWVLMALGFLAVALGVVGIFVPMLPSTPFLLIAAWAFSKGSERFHQWLLNHPWFGPPVKKWQSRGAISRRPKWVATLFILASAVYVLGFRPVTLELKILISAVLLSVLVFIWTRPER